MTSRGIRLAAIVLAVSMVAGAAAALVHTGAPSSTLPGSSAPGFPRAAPGASTIAPSLSTPNTTGGLQCDGMYYYGNPTDYYAPSFCYGHDEPTISYVSNAPHSGEDARFSFVLPSDGPVYDQGQLYATFWLGGVVTDANSTGGAGTGFLELQFYPATPVFQGPGSGSKDCLPNGAFDPNQTPASLTSNVWFSCAIVWQLGGAAGNTESAAIARPMDVVGSADTILTMHSGDRMSVGFAGVARSPTQGWNLTIDDLSSGLESARSLVNGTLVLSPYYATAAASNTLSWGASGPGAVAFAYEIGHTLDPSQTTANVSGECLPGDLACLSYWPGKWSQSGQMQLGLPVLGSGASAGFPAELGFSSSEGGAAEINDSACVQPSFSTLRNCMYPFFVYRAANYSFTFDADYGSGVVANATHTYDNEFQFPGQTGGSTPAVGFSQAKRLEPAPWGSLNALIVPANASVQFNAAGRNTTVPVSPDGSASGEFLEGAYWLNVSLPGCPSYSAPVYLATGASFAPTVNLYCPYLTAGARSGPTSAPAGTLVFFTSVVSGGSSPYTFAWIFGDGSTSAAINPAHAYASPGTYRAELTVTAAGGASAFASTTVVVTPRWALGASASTVTLYANDVAASGTSLPSVFPMSTSFPSNQSDLNSGYLFPGPVAPTTWTFSLNQSTDGTLYLDPSTAATAHFFLSVQGTGVSTPGAVPVTVVAQLFDGSGVLGTGAETRNLSAGGTVAEYNISFDVAPSTLAAPDALGLSFTWYTVNVQGSAVSAGLFLHSGANYPIGIDLPMLGPVLLSVPSVVTSASTVTASATVLSPFGGYDLEGVTGTVDGRSVGIPSVAGSEFTWTIPVASLSAGAHTFGVLASDLQGRTVAASTGFSVAARYAVSFSEFGLPTGTSWSLTVGGATVAGTGSTLSTSLANGSYGFRVGPVAGFVASPPSGTVSVAGAAVSVPIVFTVATFVVSFSESGLAKGKSWSVTLGGVTRTAVAGSSGASTIMFAEPNGSFAYAVVAKAYVATPSSGSVTVQGAPVSVSVIFSRGVG